MDASRGKGENLFQMSFTHKTCTFYFTFCHCRAIVLCIRNFLKIQTEVIAAL